MEEDTVTDVVADPETIAAESATAETTATDVVESDVSETEPAQAPPGWEDRITQWGGEDEVVAAIALRDALRHEEGVRSLFIEAAAALKLDQAAVQALLSPSVGEYVETSQGPAITLDDLRADPDRTLTAGELLAVLEAQRAAEEQERAEAATRAAVESGHAAIRLSIDNTFNDLQVTDPVDRQAVLAIADQLLPDVDYQTPPAEVAAAVRQAHTTWTARLEEKARSLVAAKAEVAATLPSPLPQAGGVAGGEPLAAPSGADWMEEAKKRARARLGIA